MLNRKRVQLIRSFRSFVRLSFICLFIFCYVFVFHFQCICVFQHVCLCRTIFFSSLSLLSLSLFPTKNTKDKTKNWQLFRLMKASIRSNLCRHCLIWRTFVLCSVAQFWFCVNFSASMMNVNNNQTNETTQIKCFCFQRIKHRQFLQTAGKSVSSYSHKHAHIAESSVFLSFSALCNRAANEWNVLKDLGEMLNQASHEQTISIDMKKKRDRIEKNEPLFELCSSRGTKKLKTDDRNERKVWKNI